MTRPVTDPDPGVHDASHSSVAKLAVPAVLIAAGFLSLVAGPEPFAVVLGLLFVISYLELRRLLGGAGSRLSLVLGVFAVGGLTTAGYAGRPELLPWGMAGLVLALLAARVLLLETGGRSVDGATADVASTAAAAGIVGLLGAHVLLLRGLPRVGMEGTLLFGLVVVTAAVLAAVGNRMFGRRCLAERISSTRTWEGAAFGLAGALVVGAVTSVRLDLPFSLPIAVALSAMVALLVSIGDLTATAVQRSAGLDETAGWVPGVGEVLNATDGILFSAPFFYWAFRTLVI